MSDEQQQEQSFNVADGPIYLPDDVFENPRRNPVRRAVIAAGVIFWFMILLLPLFFFIMATNGEIRIGLPNAPDPQSQALFKVNLISEIDYRGFSFTRSAIQPAAGTNAICVQTMTSYLLWEGEGEAAIYCDCYQRDSAGTGWMFTETNTGACS